jgi:hypothetical protein
MTKSRTPGVVYGSGAVMEYSNMSKCLTPGATYGLGADDNGTVIIKVHIPCAGLRIQEYILGYFGIVTGGTDDSSRLARYTEMYAERAAINKDFHDALEPVIAKLYRAIWDLGIAGKTIDGHVMPATYDEYLAKLDPAEPEPIIAEQGPTLDGPATSEPASGEIPIIFNISEKLVKGFIDRIRALCTILPELSEKMSEDITEYIIASQQDFFNHFFSKLVINCYNLPGLRTAVTKFIVTLIQQHFNSEIDPTSVLYKFETNFSENNNPPDLIDDNGAVMDLYFQTTMMKFNFMIKMRCNSCRTTFNDILTNEGHY